MQAFLGEELDGEGRAEAPLLCLPPPGRSKFAFNLSLSFILLKGSRSLTPFLPKSSVLDELKILCSSFI